MSKQNAQQIYSNYKSDNETNTIETPVPQSSKVEEQMSNTIYSTEQVSPTYPKWQERFDDKFIQKNDYLLSNYRAKEGINKQAPKFSVIVNISEIYGLPGIHEYINEKRPLRAVIDIDVSKEKIEAENINTKNEEIIKGLVIMISSDNSKCSYHLLYALTLLVDYQELKEFTELVYKLTGEKYVQPPTSLRYEVRPCILSIEKINNQKKIIVGHDALKKYANLVLQKYSKYLGSWDIKEKDSQYVSLICHLREDVQGITHVLIREFLILRIKIYHEKSDLIKKSQDFSNVEEAWKDVDLVTYTNTLKIGVSCTNPKFEYAFCLFKSYIETNTETNQMLFCMRYIKEYTCHIEQRSLNLLITEEGLFHWLLKAKHESLPQELQNRGIFPDVESIIRNKDILITGMVVSIIKTTPKAKDDTMLLTETVKGYSSAIKAEEISDIANANILNHEIAEHLENKPRKTLEEIVSPESITEEFITDYAVETIIHEDYRNDRLITVTQAEKHQICLELLKTSKLGLLNSVLFSTYGIKYKAIDNNCRYYYLVRPFDSEDAFKLPSYQTGEGPFYENGEDIQYRYSKLSPNELETSSNSIIQDTQNLFDIC
ncbi:2589_t:CDS:10 [Scutellospora calospora]|uniref:2589_t:CDS:1 n=1 Tax=Scutellospora calospora TaxID=85575 RepID=A0ACA9JXE8_9GLOM|nr:2589_t:CDS:10 [Scutellospora calospora]